jgi:hypothetical protein
MAANLVRVAGVEAGELIFGPGRSAPDQSLGTGAGTPDRSQVHRVGGEEEFWIAAEQAWRSSIGVALITRS